MNASPRPLPDRDDRDRRAQAHLYVVRPAIHPDPRASLPAWHPERWLWSGKPSLVIGLASWGAIIATIALWATYIIRALAHGVGA